MKYNYNPSVIEVLVEEYADMIYRIAMHQVNSKADAEDIVQCVFLKLIEKAPEFINSNHEKAWIIRVTINLCKDHFKSAWYRKIIPINESIATKEEKTDESILWYVRKLSVNQRNAIYLYYYEELSVADIAKILSVKENTVMSWLHRGRAKLKKMMKGEAECLKIDINQK